MKEVIGIAGLTPDQVNNIVLENPIKDERIKESVQPYPGQFVWQLDLNTGKITKAEYEEINYQLGTDQMIDVCGILKNDLGGVRKKLIEKKGCIYTVAINLTNAERKFKKALS